MPGMSRSLARSLVAAMNHGEEDNACCHILGGVLPLREEARREQLLPGVRMCDHSYIRTAYYYIVYLFGHKAAIIVSILTFVE